MLGRTLEAVDFVQEEEYVILPYQDSYYFQGNHCVILRLCMQSVL